MGWERVGQGRYRACEGSLVDVADALESFGFGGVAAVKRGETGAFTVAFVSA